MEIYLNRDSVCAADDIDSHEKIIIVDDSMPPDEIIKTIKELNYLPEIWGGYATWTLSSKIPIAVFAQEWTEPKKISWMPINLKDLNFNDNILKFYFSYQAQMPPDIVIAVLRRLKL